MPQRFTRQGRATADATGTAMLEFQPMGNVDWVVLGVNVKAVMPDPASLTQASIVCLLNGAQVATTSSGNRDTATGREVLRSGDVFGVQFAGADPGAVCTAVVRGVAYPFGQGPAE